MFEAVEEIVWNFLVSYLLFFLVDAACVNFPFDISPYGDNGTFDPEEQLGIYVFSDLSIIPGPAG